MFFFNSSVRLQRDRLWIFGLRFSDWWVSMQAGIQGGEVQHLSGRDIGQRHQLSLGWVGWNIHCMVVIKFISGLHCMHERDFVKSTVSIEHQYKAPAFFKYYYIFGSLLCMIKYSDKIFSCIVLYTFLLPNLSL